MGRGETEAARCAAWRYRAADASEINRTRSGGCGRTRAGWTLSGACMASASTVARRYGLIGAVGFVVAFKRLGSRLSATGANNRENREVRARGQPEAEMVARCAAQCAASNRPQAGCGDCALPL